MDQFDQFIDSIKKTVPTHTPEEFESMKHLWKDIEFEYLSTLVAPRKLVIKTAITFVQKFASYGPAKDVQIKETFFASMPLIIYSTSKTSIDRTLLWGNGGVSYSSNDHLTLFVDKDLYIKLKEIDESD